MSELFNCCTGGVAPDWLQFKSLEIGGCVSETMPNGDTFVVGGKSPDEAEFWTIYARHHDGEAAAITDNDNLNVINEIAHRLSAISGLPIFVTVFLKEEVMSKKVYPIVASNYIAGAEDFVKTLQPGCVASLVREPTNRYDSNAVAVWIDGRKIGYIPKKQNQVLALFIDQAGDVIPAEQMLAMDAAEPADGPLRSVSAKFIRSPNSSFPMVEIDG